MIWTYLDDLDPGYSSTYVATQNKLVGMVAVTSERSLGSSVYIAAACGCCVFKSYTTNAPLFGLLVLR